MLSRAAAIDDVLVEGVIRARLRLRIGELGALQIEARLTAVRTGSSIRAVESVIVSEWNAADLQAFMDSEWPRHDEPRGIRWVAHDVLLVARDDEEPIGAARGVLVGGVGELKQLLVKKGRDGRGVGSRLLLEFEARCRAAGCHKIRLDTAEYQARPFYERHGYACVATLANDRFGKALYILEKHLPLRKP